MEDLKEGERKKMIDEEPQWREEREHGVSTGPFFQSSTIRYDTIRRGFVHARDGLTTDFTGDSAPGGWSRILGRELQSCPVTHKQLTVTTHTHSSSLIPVSAPRVKTGHTHAAHGSFALLGLSVANFIINTKVMERKRRKKKKGRVLLQSVSQTHTPLPWLRTALCSSEEVGVTSSQETLSAK